ncbi:class I SAM-dependent methyltransferase [Streptomyces cinereoruber]|uniref:class I SAM-dependent methyltransferase n=1 Tax=Streptomyces cinereoruber TaxID=67260 RepID=UPI00362DF838
MSSNGSPEEAMQRVLTVLNGGMLSLMISIGHRTSLFDVLAELPASTSSDIARQADLDERYVREWLRAMTVGSIVSYDASEDTYALPPEMAMFLTRAAGPGNLATFTQTVGLLASVEGDIVEAFANGGGVAYSKFPHFQALMAEASGMSHDALLLNSVVPVVDGLHERLTAGADVLDVGCGRGYALQLLADAYPRSSFTGYDISEAAIGFARAAAEGAGLSNVSFELVDAATISQQSKAFDVVMAFDAIHDQAFPDVVLREIRKVLRESGVFLCVDIAASSHVAENVTHPLAPYLYTVSCMHCMTVSLADGGAGLGAMWGRELAVSMMSEAGFTDVQIKNVEGDIMNQYYVARP